MDSKSYLEELFERCFGREPEVVEQLPPSGSSRLYFRLSSRDNSLFGEHGGDIGCHKEIGEERGCVERKKEPIKGGFRGGDLGLGGVSCIGTCGADLRENRLFFRFTEHFRAKGCNLPEIYYIDEATNGEFYLQEDLGSTSLCDLANNHCSATSHSDSKTTHPCNPHFHSNPASQSTPNSANPSNPANKRGAEPEPLGPETLQLFKRALTQLVEMQFAGLDLDYSECIPRPTFDHRTMMWDLNYFKYCFLKLSGTPFDENLLENDFEKLATEVASHPAESFMYRDFQSRNIMVKGDKIYFIDYQGGRRGPSEYDAASLIFDAAIEMTQQEEKELLEHYIREIERVKPGYGDEIRKGFYHTALLRLLQAMGAFGLRGLYEGKQIFIDSIVPGLKKIERILQHLPSNSYTEIATACAVCLDSTRSGS